MIRTVAETASTNADLIVDAAYLPHGSWLRAERQTAGRGRRGRAWTSPAGNLHASTLVRLASGDPPAATLALVAAVALHEALATVAEAAGLTIKWPNDLLLDGRKLAGILLERSGDAVVIGFGVNLCTHPDLADYRTTSLSAAGLPAPDAGAFVETLADTVARRVAQWRSEGVPAIRTAWLGRAHPIGTALLVRESEGAESEGLFDGLDSDGALRLRTANGIRSVHAADVFPI